MNNLDYWKTFVGEQSPEDFMRAFGAMDPELSVSRFLEERGHLYGVVNQGSWSETFQAPDQYHRHTVRMYLLSYLDETREDWEPALEAKPPSIPRRYREKFDQDKYPPPPAEEHGEGTPDDVSADDTAPADSETAADESAAEEVANVTDSEVVDGASAEDASPDEAVADDVASAEPESKSESSVEVETDEDVKAE